MDPTSITHAIVQLNWALTAALGYDYTATRMHLEYAAGALTESVLDDATDASSHDDLQHHIIEAMGCLGTVRQNPDVMNADVRATYRRALYAIGFASWVVTRLGRATANAAQAA